MKSIALTLGAFAALVTAQDIASLPQCGQACASDMLSASKAAELNCEANDLSCLCQNPNFIYGFRDCSSDNCDPDQARQIVEYGVERCAAEGVAITEGPGGSVSATATGEGETSGSDGAGGAGGLVSTILSTLTSDGEAMTTPIATTTLSGAEASSSGDGESGSESGATESTSGGTAVPVLVSTFTSDGSEIITTLTTLTTPVSSASESAGSASTTGSSASDATESGATETGDESSTETGESGEPTGTDATGTGGEATSTDEGDAAMPQRTFAPGLVAAAGLAALLL